MVPKTKVILTRNEKFGQRIVKAIGIGYLFVLLSVSLFFSQAHNEETPPLHKRKMRSIDPSTITFKEEVVLAKEGGVLEEGTLETESLPYLHCSPSKSQPAGSLVLLHGAKFKKEDWKKGGLLQSFCRDFNVLALDLGVREGHAQLQNVLQDVEKELQIPLPISALVTPSASGFTVVDWLKDDIRDFSQYVKRWIPVAPPSVSTVDDTKLSQLKAIPILAIYGSQDIMGKQVSTRLGEMSEAQVVEIPGGSHPCYLDRPDEFVRHVKAFLEQG